MISVTSVVVLVGNPQPNSRTRLVAEEMARQIGDRMSGVGPITIAPTIELADVADRLFRFPHPIVDELTARVAAADLVIVASPTYKATYTGLLKAFLDRYPGGGLSRVTAVPILTVGSPAHSLAVEHGLRPLLVELGASVPTRGLAFLAGEVDERARVIGDWLDAEWPRLAPHLQPGMTAAEG